MVNCLRHKVSLSGVNFVASVDGLKSIVPTFSTLVVGTKSLVDQVLSRTDIPDLHIFEMLRYRTLDAPSACREPTSTLP